MTGLALAACSAAPSATPTEPATPTRSPVVTPTPSVGGGVGTGSPSPSSAAIASPSPTPTQAADPLLAWELTDVRTGQSFTLAEVAAAEGPVLLEPMAIWCSNCRAQQHEVARAHDVGEFASVSLDVDLTELPEDLAAYAENEGFAWRFAMADAELYRLLQDRFGTAATNPPSTPLVVVERDGTVRPLEFGAGIRSAEDLLAEIEG